MMNEPLLPPPAGVSPNFQSPESRAYAVYIVASICLPLVVTFSGLRIYAKLVIMRKRTLDDCESCVMADTLIKEFYTNNA